MSIGAAPPDPTGFGPPDPALDHLVYAVPDLAAATRDWVAATGITPAEGGRHVGRGTRNVLVGFGPTSYLEIIGPDPEHPADPDATVPFGLDALTRARLLTWAVHPVDIEAAGAAAARAGVDLGAIAPMSRHTPDGTLLEWRLTAVHPAPLDGIVPFLIDWGATPHPAAALPRLALRGLRATHPDPAAVATALDAVDVRLAVTDAPAALCALLDTPRGPVLLS